ncbi:MAG: hypothetical protein ACFB6R_06875 [Alphaproteobacteria bacterium]
MKALLKGTTALAGVALATAAFAADVPTLDQDAPQEQSRELIEQLANDAAFAQVPGLRAPNVNGATNELLSRGEYLGGDKHNHTTCSDGSTSVKVLADQSLVAFDLDWFGMVGHGGSGATDCRFTDADYSNLIGGAVNQRVRGGGNGFFDSTLVPGNDADGGALWVDTIGADAILGDEAFSTFRVADDPTTEEREAAQVMWRWQSVRDFQYEDTALAGIQANKPAFTGLEWVVPGHEHSSAAILDGQFPDGEIGQIGNADAMAQFEYLWDRADNDFSGGKEAGFEDIRNGGLPKEPNVAGDHDKSVRAVEWLRANYPVTSFAVAAHVERQGSFVPGQNRGYNVEHLRDWHNAGLLADDITAYSLSFGAEFQAGHQPAEPRGTYGPNRPSAGLGTYGGNGAYGAAEVSLPGRNFAGEPLTADDLEGTGINPAILDSTPERVTLGRPGVRTLWDALLGEGRRFFVVGSSDWHNRGIFGPFEPQTNFDFWPGEYQKMYSYVPNSAETRKAEAVVAGLRSGNTYTVMGDLIADDLAFVACYDVTGQCVTMGQTLEIFAGEGNVTYQIRFTDPEGTNNAPYTFPNPSLFQLGIEQPLNEPSVHHVDVIVGDVTGEITPDQPEYTTNVSNPTARLFFTFDESNWVEEEGGVRVLRWMVPVNAMAKDSYVRFRATNMPQGTPNETDAEGNPLLDLLADNIPCPFVNPNPDEGFDPAFCPDHMLTNENGELFITADVEAWADLWVYGNPIFIDVVEE